MTEYHIKDLIGAALSPTLSPFTKEEQAQLSAVTTEDEFLKLYKRLIKSYVDNLPEPDDLVKS
jgi:hypothetical protein